METKNINPYIGKLAEVVAAQSDLNKLGLGELELHQKVRITSYVGFIPDHGDCYEVDDRMGGIERFSDYTIPINFLKIIE